MKKFIFILSCAVLSLTIVFSPLSSTSSDAVAAQQNPESRYSEQVQPFGGTLLNVQYRTVEYAHKEVDTYSNPYKAPTFIPSLPNACAVEAGGNAIVYYDRLYNELIPNYTHNYIWGVFTYGSQNSAVTNMFTSLHSLMGTTQSGTTISGFKSGLSSYVTGKNRTAQIISATGSYYNINFNYLKAQLELEKMAVIFVDTYSITPFAGIQVYDGYDEITHNVYTGCHTMLVYGYYDINYYDANWDLVSRDTYLYVATGFAGAKLGLINIRDFCTVDDAYVINIY